MKIKINSSTKGKTDETGKYLKKEKQKIIGDNRVYPIGTYYHHNFGQATLELLF